jgi:ABC-type polysaccharide transport system, permease component
VYIPEVDEVTSLFLSEGRELMDLTTVGLRKSGPNNNIGGRLKKRFLKHKYLYLMLLPGFVYLLVFKYLPMVGIVIAFQDYNIFKGIWASPWIGFEQFKRLFEMPDFYMVLRNTFLISIYRTILGFPIPIVVALLLNEVGSRKIKKTLQTIVYAPYLLSWVVIASITMTLLSPSTGITKIFTDLFGGTPILYVADKSYFRGIIVLTNIWRGTGWYTVFYMATLSNIETELYEAAAIDGANRWRQLWNITLPSLKSTIVILLILEFGFIMDAGFEQVFAFLTPAVRDVGEIIDTFVYDMGIQQTDFSFSTAVGVFKSVIAMFFVLVTNKAAKKMGERGLW